MMIPLKMLLLVGIGLGCREVGSPPPGQCRGSVAILEYQPYHDEVMFTIVRLAQVAGACVTVLKVISGYREYDLFPEMRRWAPKVKVVHGPKRVKEYLKRHRPEILVINTFEEITKKDLPNSRLLEDLAPVIQATTIVAGCHNLGPCFEMFGAFSTKFPKLAVKTTPLVYHPALAPKIAKRAQNPRWSRPIVSLPLYFGPDRRQVHNDAMKKLKILIVGSITGTRRNYGVLEKLAANSTKIELAVFGSGDVDDHLRSFMRNISKTSNLAISFHRGNYSTLFQLARSAAYMAPLIDASTPTFQRYVDGKLSSALAVATGFLVPVIGADTLVSSFGLPNQILHDARGGPTAFVDAVHRAVTIYHDPPRYAALKTDLCRFRSDLFTNASRRFRELRMMK